MTSKDGQAVLARAIVDALKQWREMTKGGTVPKQKLRNLRFQYFDPKQQEAKPQKTEQPKAGVKADARSGRDGPTRETAGGAEPQASTDGKDAPKPDKPAATDASGGKAEAPAASVGDMGTYFAVQIFSVAKPLKSSDKRLQGLRDVAFVEADGRYKAIHGHATTYADAKKLLADVRKLFPDAFIVAYDGGRQVSTSEAISKLGQ